jgi:D-serine dehydratase
VLQVVAREVCSRHVCVGPFDAAGVVNLAYAYTVHCFLTEQLGAIYVCPAHNPCMLLLLLLLKQQHASATPEYCFV